MDGRQCEKWNRVVAAASIATLAVGNGSRTHDGVLDPSGSPTLQFKEIELDLNEFLT